MPPITPVNGALPPRGPAPVAAAEIRTLLAASLLFRRLPAPELDAAAAAAGCVTAPARTALFHQGDPAESLLLLVRGLVKMWQVGGSGAPSVIRIMEPGDAIGCVAVFRRIPYPATATALTESVLLSWPAVWVGEAMARSPALQANALAVAGHRAEGLVHRLHEMTTERVEQRLARTLLRLAAPAGPAASGAQTVAPISRQDIAEIVGTDQYVVSRLLRRWATQGLVRAERMRVALLDPGRLARIADGAC